MARAHRGASGFTLLELLAVLAILAVSAALVAPAVGRGSEGLRLRGEAGRIAALLREARQVAVTRQRSTRVTLDRLRNTVTLETLGDPKPLRQLAIRPGVSLVIARGTDQLRFSARGVARETRWLIEARSGPRLEIRVDALGGRVSVVAEDRS
jgi:prepilin-type N-terminal cleavage/methylation domain-containing protein